MQAVKKCLNLTFKVNFYALFYSSPLIQYSKFNNFLWVLGMLILRERSFQFCIPPFENSTTRIAIVCTTTSLVRAQERTPIQVNKAHSTLQKCGTYLRSPSTHRRIVFCFKYSITFKGAYISKGIFNFVPSFNTEQNYCPLTFSILG